QENVRKVWAAGGVVAAGTDQSSGPALQRELELLGAAGIKPFDILTIATHNGAVLLGKADTLGSVEPGKFADLLLLNADPTADIENVKKIAWVMKAGEIVDESKLPMAGGQQKRRVTPSKPSVPGGLARRQDDLQQLQVIRRRAEPPGLAGRDAEGVRGRQCVRALEVQGRRARQDESEQQLPAMRRRR